MRTVLLALVLMVLALPACAQTMATPGARGEPQQVVVFGKTFTLTPFQMSHTQLTWDDVKGKLPEDLAQAPAQPMSDEDILNAVDERLTTHVRQYDKDIKRISEHYMSVEKDIPNLDYAERLISGQFHESKLAEIYPEEQLNHDQYLAYKYLKEMLREEMGLGAPRF